MAGKGTRKDVRDDVSKDLGAGTEAGKAARKESAVAVCWPAASVCLGARKRIGNGRAWPGRPHHCVRARGPALGQGSTSYRGVRPTWALGPPPPHLGGLRGGAAVGLVNLVRGWDW